ncbi:MAG: hypothetical protein CMM49_04040 [Rhodospirillaceae bacterium]|nr:hypothetical protein [Rhodospirillaceae bacterium]|tara:strand:- start:3350 stop:4489 length:1140 start_codon:yes stop_codon:yes gene_type:complete
MTENDSDELKFNSRLKLKNISNLSDSYDGVGADLKIARNRKGLKIEDVANSIRISSIYIKAIEEGRFDDLPGETYIVGFIKTYSKYLGLDQDIIYEQFKKESVRSQNVALEFPVTRYRENFPTKKIIFSCLALIILAYFVYVYFFGGSREVVKNIDTVPETILNSTDNIISDKEQNLLSKVENKYLNTKESYQNLSQKKNFQNSDSVKETEKDILVENKDIKEKENMTEKLNYEEKIENNMDKLNENIYEDAYEEEEIIEDPINIQNGSVVSNNIQETSENMNEDLNKNEVSENIELSASKNYIMANEDIWVHINIIDGAVIFSGIIRKGNRLNIPETVKWNLSTGNAGSLEIFINDKKLAPPGGKGQILKNFSIYQED